jgi:hypothetical protein
MADGDPVSWLVIERGWSVVDAHGNEFGSVVELAGDTAKDVFDGLVVMPDSSKDARYVPAEAVTTITQGCVETRLDRQAVEALPPYEEPPPSIEISSEKAPLRARVRSLWPWHRSQS